MSFKNFRESVIDEWCQKGYDVVNRMKPGLEPIRKLAQHSVGTIADAVRKSAYAAIESGGCHLHRLSYLTW